MQDHFKHCFGFIYLTENKKGEKGTVLLTEALKANTTLTQLFMKCLEERQWTFEIQSVHEKNCFIFITGLKQNTIISHFLFRNLFMMFQSSMMKLTTHSK